MVNYWPKMARPLWRGENEFVSFKITECDRDESHWQLKNCLLLHVNSDESFHKV